MKKIQLTEEQRQALKAVEARHGRRWKAELRIAWEKCSIRDLGIDERLLNGNIEAVLIHLRNTIGPSGLLAIRTADLEPPVPSAAPAATTPAPARAQRLPVAEFAARARGLARLSPPDLRAEVLFIEEETAAIFQDDAPPQRCIVRLNGVEYVAGY
jgi:hypothetical protein